MVKFKLDISAYSKYLDWAKSYSDILCKGSLFFLIFLLPIFFLPWTLNVLDFNKQALLIVLSFVALFAWMTDVLVKGRINFYFTYFYVPLAVLILVVLVSSFSSLWSYGSFWGWPLAGNESFITILALALVFFLAANIFEKKDISRAVFIFFVSWMITVVYAILQIFSKFILSIDFTKSASFNMVGSVYSIGMITAATLPLAALLMINSKKLQKSFYISYLVLSLFFLLLINFSSAWIVLAFNSVLAIIVGNYKKSFFDTRWLIMPMFFLAVSLLFLIFKFNIVGLPNPVPEVMLRHGTSLQIAKNALGERPVFGTGPGTFPYDFAKFKPKEINQSNFWDARFESSSSKAMNIIATTGVAGIFAYFLVFIFALAYGMKFLVKKESKSKEQDILSFGLLAGFFSVIIGYFLYGSNITLDFFFIFFTAVFLALNFGGRKEIALKSSSLTTLFFTFAFTLIFILFLGIGILEGQRYYAEAKYFSSLKNLQEGRTMDSIKDLEKAVVLISGKSGNDIHLRQLSQTYLIRMQEELVRSDISKEQAGSNAQILISNAINAAKIATEINPKNIQNWDNLGGIYQSIAGVIKDSEDWAVKSYDEAIKLDPNNPYFYTQKGSSLLRKAEQMKEGEERTKALDEAKVQLEKALELKSDYYLPHLNLSALYQLLDNRELAVKEMIGVKDSTYSQDSWVVLQLGLLYFRYQEYQKAVNEFQLAAALNPSYSNALYFLSLSFDKLGQKQKATEAMARVLQLNPDNQEVKTIIENLKAGRSALAGLSPEEPSVVPEEDKKSEKLPVKP